MRARPGCSDSPSNASHGRVSELSPGRDYCGMDTIDVSTFSGQLDQNPHELGNAEVLALAKVNCTALLIRGEPHVDVLAVFTHLYSFASGKRMWKALAT